MKEYSNRPISLADALRQVEEERQRCERLNAEMFERTRPDLVPAEDSPPLRSIYVIGSLRNEAIPKIANQIERALGIEAFDDWYSPGPETDDRWRDHEISRGNPFPIALYGHHARNVFEFDKRHLDRCDAAVLVMPAGKSGHLELGYIVGCGKPAFVLFDGVPERWDIMYQFATAVFFSVEDFLDHMQGYVR